MILLLLALTSSILICPSYGGGLTPVEFENTFEKWCFNLEKETEPNLINGQINPLSQTLENFIALAEKLEEANPHIRIKEELFHFVNNYIYENIEYRESGDVGHWVPKEFQPEIFENYWEPDMSLREKKEDITVPYSRSENCSLFFMLSHSILTKAAPDDRLRSATNDTIFNFRTPQESYIKDKGLYPQEIGVVSVKGTKEAVALGKVLTGLYVGLQPDTKRSILNDKPKIPLDKLQDEETMIDTLYAVTMGEVISLARWRPEYQQRDGLAGDGEWVSVPVGTELETKDVCPMIYKLREETTASQSHSSMRGAADGLILGKVIKSIAQTKSEVKLSEILRMYYSRGGISAKTEESIELWASHCNREYNLNSALEKFLFPQVRLFQLLVSQSYKLIDENVNKAWEYYQSSKSSVFGLWSKEHRDMCSADLSVDNPENLPLESPLDIIAVIDTNTREFVRRQQLILGYMAKELELRYRGSRMTILSDQKLTSSNSSSSGAVVLTPLIEDTYSSACAACFVTQFTPEELGTPALESEVIIAIDQLLKDKKEKDSKQNGVKGKVVIYFNFKEDKKSSRIDPEEVREEKALKDMLLRHIDVAVFALGRSNDLIKKYARSSAPYIMSAVDDTEDVVGRELAKRVAKAPAILQYPDCSQGSRENYDVYEDYVSRNALQHWQMPARYFYKSRSFKFTFESTYGSVKVCHNRATPKTENIEENCKKGTKVEFKDSNPCKGFNEITCSPYYFSIMGINSTDDGRGVCTDSNTENKCKTMDQIRFKVTHEGIRCSGCSGLLSTPVLLLLGVLSLLILSKTH